MNHRNRFLVVCVFAIICAGCKKETGAGKAATAPEAFPRSDTAPLWKLVPTSAQVAVVVSDGAFVHLHKATTRFLKDFAGAPGGAKAIAEMNREAKELSDFLAPGGVSAAGIDLARGAVLYMTGEKDVTMVLPVSDRAAFFKLAEGEKQGNRDVFDEDMLCDEIGGRYVCASTEALLDSFGKGDGMSPPPGDAQGHVEFLVTGELMESLPPQMGGMKEIRGGVTLEAGGLTARVSVAGDVPAMMRTSGAPRLLADVAGLRPTGIFTVRAKQLFPMLAAEMPAEVRGRPGPGGLIPGELIDALDGEIGGYALAGAPGGVLRIGLKDEAPFARLIGMCEELLPPMVGKGVKDGERCTFTVTPPGSPTISTTIWVKDKSLQFGLGDFEGKRDAPPIQPMALELIEKPWTFAAWGHGGFLSPEWKKLFEIPELAREMKSEEAQMGIWFFLHLAELGVAARADDNGAHGLIRLRTSWSNSDEVLEDLEPIFSRIAGGDFAALDDIAALGTKHGSSPLASDLKAGVGAAAPMALFGTLAAVAIPSFTKYVEKSKSSEAQQFVKKMFDGARAHYMDGGEASLSLTPTRPSFPATSTKPTPPLGSCCARGAAKCEPNASLWAREPWLSLQFSVDDPHYYSYQYVVADDGQSFTARAFGDLDCDGVYSTFEMVGGVDPDGSPSSASLSRENENE